MAPVDRRVDCRRHSATPYLQALNTPEESKQRLHLVSWTWLTNDEVRSCPSGDWSPAVSPLAQKTGSEYAVVSGLSSRLRSHRRIEITCRCPVFW